MAQTFTLTRRELIVSGLSLLLSGCTTGGEESNERQLNILCWADYLHPDTIPEFERRFGLKVVYDTFASNEALLSKLQAGGSKYDIIVPSSYMVKQLKRMKLLDELDHARIKGFSNLMPRLLQSQFDPGLTYCVPYTWGTSGIGYNTEIFGKCAVSTDRPSWDLFWDKRFDQRMTLLDDGREVLGMAMKRSGGSYNCLEEGKISAGADALKVQKPLVMCYSSDQVIVALSSGDSYLSQIFSGDAYQARRENPQVGYAIPKEGASVWTDNFCIPRTAPHKDFAYLWLSYMLEPAVAAKCAKFTHYATANQAAFKLVSAEMKDDPNLYPPENILDTCEELHDIGQAVFLYDRYWTEVKCS